MRFALVNHSRLVDDEQAHAIARAVDTQIHHHVAPAWARAVAPVRFYSRGGAPDESILIILADDDATPGALGYHDERGDRPYASILVPTILGAPGGSVLAGSTSVSGVVSHEAIETVGDPVVDAWRDYPPTAGAETAEEWCDAVQGDAYYVDAGGVSVSVSNFLLPAWFDAQATRGPFDYMRRLSAPFSMSPGGYLIIRKNGRSSQVFGHRPKWRAGSRRHARRGVELAFS